MVCLSAFFCCIFSHQQWRCLVKRERRRRLRQIKARERDKLQQGELEEYERLEELAQRQEEEEAARLREEWHLRDAALHSKFLREKERKQQQEDAQRRQEELIKKEWEEQQKKEKEEEDRKKEEQNALLEAATKGLNKESEMTHNPEPPANYPPRNSVHSEREPCPFFEKTGACRFGIHCSREHAYPDTSDVILIPNMYSHFGMEKVSYDEYNEDAALEYSEHETQDHFRDFYQDTLPEFQKYGSVIQFKVCSNTSVHLRGNVYVQYSSYKEAEKVKSTFHGRWYAGRQLNCIFVTISKWRSAVCRHVLKKGWKDPIPDPIQRGHIKDLEDRVLQEAIQQIGQGHDQALKILDLDVQHHDLTRGIILDLDVQGHDLALKKIISLDVQYHDLALKIILDLDVQDHSLALGIIPELEVQGHDLALETIPDLSIQSPGPDHNFAINLLNCPDLDREALGIIPVYQRLPRVEYLT
ncbi:U2 small nuclear ribonucleoprotein auxiliary factor 35 kDa subunit-related protein 2 [Halocaridina rubra]|uniref:U2 small nuclear ribonucleoprotein auxiliary factor 35 kDa subunit-related protein 2 n=1 Tax=Halocaridina rubra TaxID=373956 RepID=A0AAN8XFX2_HALRR